MSDMKCTCYKGGFGDVCGNCRARECKHEYAKPTRAQHISHHVPCVKCGEELFIEDYYWWLSRKETASREAKIKELEQQLAEVQVTTDNTQTLHDAEVRIKELESFVRRVAEATTYDPTYSGSCMYIGSGFIEDAIEVLDYAKQLEGGEK